MKLHRCISWDCDFLGFNCAALLYLLCRILIYLCIIYLFFIHICLSHILPTRGLSVWHRGVGTRCAPLLAVRQACADKSGIGYLWLRLLVLLSVICEVVLRRDVVSAVCACLPLRDVLHCHLADLCRRVACDIYRQSRFCRLVRPCLLF